MKIKGHSVVSMHKSKHRSLWQTLNNAAKKKLMISRFDRDE